MRITSITLIHDADLPPLFQKNPSSRCWNGAGKLRVRDIGAWGGTNIRGTVGRHEGRYDKKFVEWCVHHDILFIRTVDLFWAFEYYRHGFYRKLSKSKLRKRWEEDIRLIRSFKRQVGFKNGHPIFRPLSSAEKHEFKKRWGLGPWKSYYRQNKAYFLSELARYQRVVSFWRKCGHQARETFLRCARYRGRQADAHPDYLVATQDSIAFVEVKGPRESLHPSQRQFFPELIRCAGQKVWLARFRNDGNGIRFGQFTAAGEVLPYEAQVMRRV